MKTNLLRTVGGDIRGSTRHYEAAKKAPIYIPLCPEHHEGQGRQKENTGKWLQGSSDAYVSYIDEIANPMGGDVHDVHG